MRNHPALVVCLIFCTACSALPVLDVPPVPNPPENWSKYSTSIIPDSECAAISGVYAEPPTIFENEKTLNHVSEDKVGSYYGHIPFHLADKKSLGDGEVNLLKNEFLIRQPDANNFYFSLMTEKADIVEYHFRAEQGDFKCKDGYIEFPVINRYGMIEVMSVNYQIRNVVLRDVSDALVIQETIGPYRGNRSTSLEKFRYKFLRYSSADSE